MSSTSLKKYVKAILNLMVALVVLLLVLFLVPRILVFFMPFVIGWIIALIAGPMVRFFEEKLKIKRKAGSAVTIVVVIGLVVLVGYLIIGALIKQGVSFVQDLPELWTSLQEDFNGVYDRMPEQVQETLDVVYEKAGEIGATLFGKISSPTLTAVGNFAKQIPSIVIGIIMCLLSSYFFVAERHQIAETLQKWMPETMAFRFRIMKNSAAKSIGGYFKAQLKIEFWIYLLLVIGFLILRVEYAPLIGLGIAFLDFLPFFGTGTAMVPWAVIKFFNADYAITIGLLVLWGISQLVRQIIQPKIVGDSVGVPPIPTLFLLYIGYKFGSVWGMIVSVPIGLLIWTLYESGAFDTTKASIQILFAGLNHFRRLTPQDKAIIESYKRECEEDLKQEEEKGEQKL